MGETVGTQLAGLSPAERVGKLTPHDVVLGPRSLDLPSDGARSRVVARLAGKVSGELRPGHGRREEAIRGILLTKAGKEVLVSGYERRMLQHTRGALPGM